MPDRALAAGAIGLFLAGCLSTDTGLTAAESTGETEPSGTSTGEETSTGNPSEASTSTPTTGTSSSTSTSSDTTADPTDPTDPPEGCNQTPLRVATFNVQDVGFSSEDQHTGLVAILTRMDADIVCMQEVLWTESSPLEQAASAAGYDNVIQANRSPGIGGDPTNACVSRVPVGLFGSFSGEDISSDPDANDVGRDILAIRAQVGPGCFAGVVTVHLKSGFDYQDRFRRQIEAERLAAVIDAYREERPGDPLVVLGDFNEQFDDDTIGSSIDDIPFDLPPSYQLGDDIQLPLVYDPFARVTEKGLEFVDAKWEDSVRRETWNGSSRLDYVLFADAVLAGSEVYNACEDDGVDNDPPGDWLPKEGEPLACFASEVTSDHLPIFVDLVLP